MFEETSTDESVNIYDVECDELHRGAIMRAICIEGGTSKSTLTAALGAWLVRGFEKLPADECTKIAIVDLNFDQATLTNWWGKHGRPLTLRRRGVRA